MKKILLLIQIAFVSFAVNAQLTSKANPAQILGRVNTVTFAGSLPSNMTQTTTGSTTISYVNNRLQAAGGNGSISTNTEYVLCTYPMSGTKRTTVVVFKPIVASTLGFSIVWANVGAISASYKVRFNSITGVTTFENGATVVATSSAISFTNNSDLLQISFDFDKYSDIQTITTSNITQSATVAPVVLTAAPGIAFMVQQTALSFHGGTTQFYEVSDKSGLPRNAGVIWVGDSNTYGAGCTVYTNAFSYNSVLTSSTVQGIYGGPGSTVDDINNAITNLTIAKSKVYVVAEGTNNVAAGDNQATYSTKITTLVNSLTATGGIVILVAVPPRLGSSLVGQYNTVLSGLANGTTIFYADINTPLNNGSGSLNPTYDFGDGIHYNNAGHIIVQGVLYPIVRKYINL